MITSIHPSIVRVLCTFICMCSFGAFAVCDVLMCLLVLRVRACTKKCNLCVTYGFVCVHVDGYDLHPTLIPQSICCWKHCMLCYDVYDIHCKPCKRVCEHPLEVVHTTAIVTFWMQIDKN